MDRPGAGALFGHFAYIVCLSPNLCARLVINHFFIDNNLGLISLPLSRAKLSQRVPWTLHEPFRVSGYKAGK